MKLTLHFGECGVKLACMFYSELEARMTKTTFFFLATFLNFGIYAIAKEVWQIKIVVLLHLG